MYMNDISSTKDSWEVLAAEMERALDDPDSPLYGVQPDANPDASCAIVWTPEPLDEFARYVSTLCAGTIYLDWEDENMDEMGSFRYIDGVAYATEASEPVDGWEETKRYLR